MEKSYVLFGTATTDMALIWILLCLTCIPDKKPSFSHIGDEVSCVLECKQFFSMVFLFSFGRMCHLSFGLPFCL